MYTSSAGKTPPFADLIDWQWSLLLLTMPPTHPLAGVTTKAFPMSFRPEPHYHDYLSAWNFTVRTLEMLPDAFRHLLSPVVSPFCRSCCCCLRRSIVAAMTEHEKQRIIIINATIDSIVIITPRCELVDEHIANPGPFGFQSTRMFSQQS